MLLREEELLTWYAVVVAHVVDVTGYICQLKSVLFAILCRLPIFRMWIATTGNDTLHGV